MNKVLVIGSGGREHALGWSIAQSRDVSEVLYAPGNAGTGLEEKGRNVSVDVSKKENFKALADLIKSEEIGLTVVGPEGPLADGLVDYLNSQGYQKVFGPTQKAAQLETDKFFSFDLMQKLNIPQADSVKCYTIDEAMKAVKERTTKEGIVIKARRLTGGKGVSVCDSKEEALEEIVRHAEKYSPEVLIAERLFGQEFSVFGISDGNIVFPFEISVQDHKCLLDGDKGPNTGGMGAYCPAPIATADIVRNVVKNIMVPVVQRMKFEGAEYKGFIYAGMIMTDEGSKVLEFNVRLGDPETQPMVMMLKNSLYEPIAAALEGRLNKVSIGVKHGAACCVVLALPGYPAEYKDNLNLPISGLKEAESIEGVKVFHAGTKVDGINIVTAGGRVLGVTACSEAVLADAQRLVYNDAVPKISIPGGFRYRTDIGNKAFRL